uniref:NADH-ubiquinone oxidoreductase chain 5 n=1 Tax=Bahadzia jaraguensis TaxID=1041811 RepID=K7ZU69_BAHJA|nr:NADH dehydrogenase subunit 5 [Bahadzia jaraguensis]
MVLVKSVYKCFMIVLFVMSVFFFLLSIFCIEESVSYFLEWEVFCLNGVSVVMGVLIDWMSGVFLGVVCFISSMIMLYSEYYMEGDKNYKRFMVMLFFFVISMMFLIVSPNMVSLLLGWDGLGVTSYVLVIYYQSEYSCNAGMLTVLSNRVGDAGILMSIGLMFSSGSWNYIFCNELGMIVCFMMVLAGMTKSAQIPFSAWLPAAMAAPTPVSALVHSSTLVTAGVYLLIRLSSLMGDVVMWWLMVIGVLTMFMAGLGANFEGDLKKVIALSTLSQLGMMMMVLGFGVYELAFFHLIIHALFKSMIFMCGGVVIHNLMGSQDGRVALSSYQGGPLLCVVFSVANMALCGFPFLAGFYSKDAILESVFSGYLGVILLVVVIFSTSMTISYSLRLMYLCSNMNNKGTSVGLFDDLDKSLTISVISLFFGSVVGGFCLGWLMCMNGNVFVMNWWEKYYIYVSLIVGVLFSGMVEKGISFGFLIINQGVYQMWYMPYLSTFGLSKVMMKFGGSFEKSLDKGWYEYYGGGGSGKVLVGLFSMIQLSQIGVVISGYLLMSMIFGLLVLVVY